MSSNEISKSILSRLPLYLNYLKSLHGNAPTNISATAIALALGAGEVQVRKDLAAVSSGGKPKVGYLTKDLIYELESFLGYHDLTDAVLIGAGKLGRALLNYDGFENYGLNIVMGFDIDEATIGEVEGVKHILPLSKFDTLCARMNIRIGIITVPPNCAQSICNLMIKNGILAIWNFAPVHLDVPKNILVHNENMAASLALLSSHLAKQLHV